MKTIEESLHRGLLVGQSRNLSVGLLGRIRGARSHADEVLGDGVQTLLKSRVLRRQVLDNHAVMKLCPSFQQGCNKSYSKAASKIAKQVRDAGSLVILVQRQIGIGQRAYRHKEKS